MKYNEGMIMNCPKCGRPLEWSDEYLVGDGCMFCSSFSDDENLNKKDKKPQEPIGLVAWIAVILIMIGVIILVVRGFLWLLGV